MKITLLLFLLFLPAFFAASELSFLLIRPSKVLRLIEEKKKGAFSILKIQKRFRSSLIASQFGVTISLISIGWLSNSMANEFWEKNILPNRFFDLLLFLFVVTIVTLVSGLIPKALVWAFLRVRNVVPFDLSIKLASFRVRTRSFLCLRDV